MSEVPHVGRFYAAGGWRVNRLTNTKSIEEGVDNLLSIPNRHNSCCSWRAAAMSAGQLRQLASTAISNHMSHQTTTGGTVYPEDVPGVPAASSPYPGRLNTRETPSLLDFFRVSWLSRLKQYPSHTHTRTRTCSHARWVVDQAGHPGHFVFEKMYLPEEDSYSVFRCPTPRYLPAGTPGTPSVRWFL